MLEHYLMLNACQRGLNTETTRNTTPILCPDTFFQTSSSELGSRENKKSYQSLTQSQRTWKDRLYLRDFYSYITKESSFSSSISVFATSVCSENNLRLTGVCSPLFSWAILFRVPVLDCRFSFLFSKGFWSEQYSRNSLGYFLCQEFLFSSHFPLRFGIGNWPLLLGVIPGVITERPAANVFFFWLRTNCCIRSCCT